ncbi:hypothetical protein ACLB1O_04465 [Escherichia coli]
MPYVLAVEKLAGSPLFPDRVNVIRVMLSELFVSTATCCTSRPLFRTSAQ